LGRFSRPQTAGLRQFWTIRFVKLSIRRSTAPLTLETLALLANDQLAETTKAHVFPGDQRGNDFFEDGIDQLFAVADYCAAAFISLAQLADKGAGFRCVTDAPADTATLHRRLMLTVLGGLAEFKSELTCAA